MNPNEQRGPRPSAKKSENELPIEALASLAGSGDSSDTNDLLRQLVIGELAEKKRARDQALADYNRELLAKTAALKEERERRELGQQWCNHRKENLKPNIGGQRLSNGHTAYICQTCFKEWTDQLPANLQIDLSTVGG